MIYICDAFKQDAAYSAVGARIVSSASDALKADIVLKIRPPTPAEAEDMKQGVR